MQFSRQFEDISKQKRRQIWKRRPKFPAFCFGEPESLIEPKFDARTRSAFDSGLEQQILLVSCLFFSRRGGYGSESICYRYMMRKNWLGTLSRCVFPSFYVTDGDTRYFQYRNIFLYHKHTFFFSKISTNVFLFSRNIFVL